MKRKLLLFVMSLFLGGATFAQNQNYHWPDFDHHDFNRYMPVIARVQFNGEVQNSTTIEVASFVGNQLRGTNFLFEPHPNSAIAGQYYLYASCYYDNEGETFTFMAYDHATGIEYDVCSTTLVGQNNGYGTVEEPVILNFIREEEPTYGPEYPWIPSSNYSGEGMTFVAQIKINGQHVDAATYEVGAFCGDECRGTSGNELEDWTDVDLGYFVFMNLVGEDGDVINFYLYDLANNEVFPGVCNTTVDLVNGTEVGIDIFEGDIFVLDFVTSQTFEKTILAYTENENDHYYLIASPIGEVEPGQVTNMLENSFDLYRFNQSAPMNEENITLEWENFKANEFTTLEPGKGYLYANSGNGIDDSVTLTFTGMPYDGDGEVILVKDDTADFPGWNLIGNPFSKTAYISKPFYKMNEDGTELESEPVTGPIESMEGVFVKAEFDNETISFTTQAPEKKASVLMLNVVHSRGTSLDRAIISFSKESLLPKFMLNPNNTKLYIPQDDNDYAVVFAENDMGVMPVSFKAAENGTYTLNVGSENVSFAYLHLIDNMTGADVDLLANSSYSFNALTTDYANRFKLVFATGNSSDDNFAFFSNGSFIINNEGEATLQVVDVTGRIVKSESINGCASVSVKAAPGVYMLRLINGNNMKVQKVVVR